MSTLVPAPPAVDTRAGTAKRIPDDGSISAGARQNIHRHYDLSNELFALFLDATMTYSGRVPGSAPPGWGDLADAQHRKIDRLLDLAGVGAGTRLLEIGTGWGELALRAAARGARVTVTLSEEQRDWPAAGGAPATRPRRRRAADYRRWRAVRRRGQRGDDRGRRRRILAALLPDPRTCWPPAAGSPSRRSPCRTTGCSPPAPPTPGCRSTSSPAACCPPCGPWRTSPPSRPGCACATPRYGRPLRADAAALAGTLRGARRRGRRPRLRRGVPPHVEVLPRLLRPGFGAGYLDVQQIVLGTPPQRGQLTGAAA